MNYTIDQIISNLQIREKMFPCRLSYYPIEFQDVFEIFVDALISARKSPNTITAYYYDIKTFFKFLTQNYPTIKSISQISTITIKKYYKYLETIKFNTYTSITRKKTVLKMFFEYLIEQNILNKNNNPIPVEGVIKSNYNKNKKIPVYLELDEIITFFQVIHNDSCNDFIKLRNLSIFSLLINSGLRISELTALNISDMDDLYNKKMLTITGKGEKTRIIPINDNELQNGSLQYLNKYFLLRKEVQCEEKEALFLSNKKTRLTNRGIQLMIQKYKKNASLNKSITPHKLRHTYATQLIKNNVNLRKVQELLGHSSISTTQIYTHVNIDDLRKEILNLEYKIDI